MLGHGTPGCAPLVALLACLADPASTSAQQADSAGNGAGQQHEAGLTAASTAVSGFDNAELKARQVADTMDLARVVPNLVGHHSSGAGNSNAYFLRGLGNTETVATFDPAVGTYIDGLFVSRQSSNNYALFDIDSVEVLRGPQGTEFGRNTTAGAIRLVTRKPSPDFGGAAELGIGNFSRWVARGSVDYPINDRWLTRFSGYYEGSDGFVRSTVTDEDINDRKSYGVRGAVRFLPSNAVTWDLWVENFYQDEINPVRRCNPPPGGIEPAADCRYGVDADTSTTAFTTRNGSGTRLEQALRGEGMDSYTHAVRILSNLDWKVGAVDLTFITGRIDESWDYTLDFDPTGVSGGQSLFAVSQYQDTYQWSQEIRANGAVLANRLHYTGGIFWIDEKNETRFQDISINENPANGPLDATWLQIDRTMVNRTESLAAYLQFDFAATDRLILTAGGRYTDEDKSIRYDSREDRRPNTVLIYDISTAELIDGDVPVDQHVGEFTPRVAATYRLNAGWSLYASATNGFKSGGWNGRGSASAPCFHTPICYQSFGPEHVWSYETGFKSELPAHHMRFDATLFYADVEDMQVITGFADPTGIVFLTRNAADARFRGAEAQWSWLPWDELDLHASIGLMDAEYTSIHQPSLITTDTEPVRAPDITGDLGATYRLPIGALSGRFYIGGDLSFTDRHWVASLNAPQIAHVPSRWLYQAQAGYDSDNGHWNANLSCNNCSNEEYLTSYFLGPYLSEPRRYDFRLGYRF